MEIYISCAIASLLIPPLKFWGKHSSRNLIQIQIMCDILLQRDLLSFFLLRVFVVLEGPFGKSTRVSRHNFLGECRLLQAWLRGM